MIIQSKHTITRTRLSRESSKDSKLSLRFHCQPVILLVRELLGVSPNTCHLTHGAMYHREALSDNRSCPERDAAVRTPAAAHDRNRCDAFLVCLAGNRDDLQV